MSNPNPPTPRAAPRRLTAWIGVAALAGYVFFIAWHGVVVAGGADSSGYLNSARLFAAGRLTAELRAPAEFGPKAALDPMHFLPQGFFPDRDRTQLTPTYPTGLPLHLAAAGKVFGWTVGPWVVVLTAAAAAVWLCYHAARELELSRALAASGAVMLAAFPVFVFTAIQPLSDTPATAWGLAALYAALRTRRDPRWALAAGAALAMAVLVRPTNVLLAPALLILLGADGRRLGLFVLGGLPGAGWLAWYNHQLYGHALRSGYGDIFAAFAWVHGAPTAVHFARWLALLLPSAILILPWAVLFRRESRSRVALALAGLFAAITGCYLFYEVSHEVWWCLRFILPAVPALILGALLGVEALARGPVQRWEHPFRRGAAAALALWAVGLSCYWVPKLAVPMMKQYEQVYADASQEAPRRLPPNALVLGSAFSGSLYYYTEFPVLRTDQVEPAAFAHYATLARKAGRPICAVLFASEEAEAFRRCPGAWTRLAQIRNVGLWQLTASSPE